jgi:anti-sigma B factor antagonist
MRVALTTAEKLQVIIIRTRGKLTLGEGTSALRRKMRELVEGGYRRILLNMGDVTYIDNSGIAELVAAHTAVTNAGGEMKLLNLTKRAHDPLQIAKLHMVFEIFEDEGSAIRSFTQTDLQVRYDRFLKRICSPFFSRKRAESPEA